MTKVTQPTFTIQPAAVPNGTGVVILPGGGFDRVVPDLEGTEAVGFLNRIGVTVFVLSYRTKNSPEESGWEKPLQDAQRMMALIRSRAVQWDLDKNKIGLLGFSAGGQVAARLLSSKGKLAYIPVDDIDTTAHRPDFAILIYPWGVYDEDKDGLIDGVSVSKTYPPTFLVHTDDDRSSSLGSVLLYAGLKKRGIAAELHVYGNGGHGYGVRPQGNSEISTWLRHAGHWLDRWIKGKH
jgi:acetyl esterase/lipase